MIITLSPAKTLDFKSPITIDKKSNILFEKESIELNDIMKSLSINDITEMMQVNPKIAFDVYQYIHAFDLNKTPKRQAIFAYNGIAYQGFDAKTLATDNYDFAQNQLISISGLYGIVRPFDMIKPYRLEMQINLANSRGKNLYAYWSDTVSKYIAKKMIEDDNVWVNLSSKEYTRVVNRKLLPKNSKIITPIFKQIKGDGYKQIVVYAKKARGMMARFLIDNQITDIEYIKAFDTEGYCFAPHLSDDKEWIFIR